jgi:hypothetical protein
MRDVDWVCQKCGMDMRLKDGILSCDSLQCPVHYAPTIDDLPTAFKAGWRKFKIAGEEGYWQYAARQHAKALDRKPAEGVVVAVCCIKNRWHIRSFRWIAPKQRVGAK